MNTESNIKELIKKVRKIEIQSKKIINTLFLGESKSIFKGRGIEFSEVREYGYGDDIRLIDWNVTARMDKPFIKVNNEDRELTIYLMVDLSNSMSFSSALKSKIEVIAELCAIFALSAANENHKVGLIIFSDKVDIFVQAKKGRKQALRLIREILNYQPSDNERETNLAEALLFFDKIQKRKAFCIMLSDFYAADFKTALRFVARKHFFVPVWIKDTLEENYGLFEAIPLVDLESGRNTIVDKKNLLEVNSLVKEREALLRSIFKELKLSSLTINTAEPYIPRLMEYFYAKNN